MPLTAPPEQQPDPPTQLTPDQLADAQRYLTALQSASASGLSNASLLKKLLEQLTPTEEN